jgi:hypothetical protein
MSIAQTWSRCDFDVAQQRGIDLVPRLWFGRARTAIECFYPHPLHQRFDMPTADLAPLSDQQPSQHPRTGEGVLLMQPVETRHDREVGVRHRPRQVVDTAAADVQSFRLPDDRQIVLTVNHRFALSNPALVSTPSTKSFCQLSDLGVQRLHVDGRLGCPAAAARTEYSRSAAFELRLPRCDLVGMNVELFSKLRFDRP